MDTRLIFRIAEPSWTETLARAALNDLQVPFSDNDGHEVLLTKLHHAEVEMNNPTRVYNWYLAFAVREQATRRHQDNLSAIESLVRNAATVGAESQNLDPEVARVGERSLVGFGQELLESSVRHIERPFDLDEAPGTANASPSPPLPPAAPPAHTAPTPAEPEANFDKVAHDELVGKLMLAQHSALEETWSAFRSIHNFVDELASIKEPLREIESSLQEMKMIRAHLPATNRWVTITNGIENVMNQLNSSDLLDISRHEQMLREFVRHMEEVKGSFQNLKTAMGVNFEGSRPENDGPVTLITEQQLSDLLVTFMRVDQSGKDVAVTLEKMHTRVTGFPPDQMLLRFQLKRAYNELATVYHKLQQLMRDLGRGAQIDLLTMPGHPEQRYFLFNQSHDLESMVADTSQTPAPSS